MPAACVFLVTAASPPRRGPLSRTCRPLPASTCPVGCLRGPSPGPRASPPRRFACFPAGVVRFNPRFPRRGPLNPCRPTPPPSRKHYPLPPAARFLVPLPTSRLVPAEACYSMTLCLDLPHRRPPPAPHSASPLPALLRPALPPSPPSPPGRGTLDPRRCGLLADSGPFLWPPLRFDFLLDSTAPLHARPVRASTCPRRACSLLPPLPRPGAVPCPVLVGHFPLLHAPSAASVALPPALGLPRPGALRVSRPALCDSIRGSPVASRLIHAARHPPPPLT